MVAIKLTHWRLLFQVISFFLTAVLCLKFGGRGFYSVVTGDAAVRVLELIGDMSVLKPQLSNNLVASLGVSVI